MFKAAVHRTVSIPHEAQCSQLFHHVFTSISSVPMRCLQDDGCIAKLRVGDGTKDIKVNTPLAVIVEEKVCSRF